MKLKTIQSKQTTLDCINFNFKSNILDKELRKLKLIKYFSQQKTKGFDRIFFPLSLQIMDQKQFIKLLIKWWKKVFLVSLLSIKYN